MTATEFRKLLISLGACSEAMKWSKGKTLKTVWKTCQRADWMLWLVGKMADKPNWPTRKQVVLAACDCAETALQFVKPREDRPRRCIEITRQWCAGTATIQQVRDARAAAADAAAAAVAAVAVADAAVAVADAAVAVADAAVAADAAAAAVADADADAAVAADAAAAAVAAAAARAKALATMADLVRNRLTLDEVL